MRFRNMAKVSRSTPVTQAIHPGAVTSEQDFLLNALHTALDDKMLDVLLTNEEESLAKELLTRNERARHEQNIPQPKDNLKAMSDRLTLEHEAEIALHNSKVYKAHKEEEMFADRPASDKTVVVTPKKLDGKPKSLSDIINHNAAIGQ